MIVTDSEIIRQLLDNGIYCVTIEVFPMLHVNMTFTVTDRVFKCYEMQSHNMKFTNMNTSDYRNMIHGTYMLLRSNH